MAVLISCQALTKSFGARPLFKDITLGLSDGERMGLIGPNGTGKSTLLRIFAGEERPDRGDISRKRDVRLVYLPQEDIFTEGETVEAILRYVLHDQPLEEYEVAARVATVLAKVGFVRADEPVSSLSGGWKKRLALARALIQRPDLLLLDEPTNHLDLEGVLWMEALLKEAPFAFLLVSHDRLFLEHVTNRVVELNRVYPEGYLSVNGNYSDFLTRREEFLQAQSQQQHALEGQVKREIEWLRRGPQARTTKAQSRIDAAHKLIGDLADVKYRNAQDKALSIDFTASLRKTKELLVGKNLAKTLGGRLLFQHLDLTLSPGIKLGLLGPNGSGKSTLLRLLTGALESDSGTIKRAEGLRIVLFDQNRAQLDKNISLRQALSPNGDTVLFRDSSMHVASWAKRFLFRSEQLEMPVSHLSGGEQARILIANLMLTPADLLILDEPTNDLDIASLEVLEESLDGFPGALVLVTHDRYMLDTVSNELLALDGAGHVAYYADYAQWEATQRKRELDRIEEERKQAQSARSNLKPAAAVRRLSTAEQRELAQMEESILAAEAEVEAAQRLLSAPEVVSDYRKVQQAMEMLAAAEAHVAKLYTRWDELEARRGA